MRPGFSPLSGEGIDGYLIDALKYYLEVYIIFLSKDTSCYGLPLAGVFYLEKERI